MKCLKWNPPPAEVHKLNYDAAIRDQMTYPAVVNRSVDGQIHQAWGDFSFTGNPLPTEFRACLIACHLALQLYLENVIVEGDSPCIQRKSQK